MPANVANAEAVGVSRALRLPAMTVAGRPLCFNSRATGRSRPSCRTKAMLEVTSRWVSGPTPVAREPRAASVVLGRTVVACAARV